MAFRGRRAIVPALDSGVRLLFPCRADFGQGPDGCNPSDGCPYPCHTPGAEHALTGS